MGGKGDALEVVQGKDPWESSCPSFFYTNFVE